MYAPSTVHAIVGRMPDEPDKEEMSRDTLDDRVKRELEKRREVFHDSVNRELNAMATIVTTLYMMQPDERARVLSWAVLRYTPDLATDDMMHALVWRTQGGAVEDDF